MKIKHTNNSKHLRNLALIGFILTQSINASASTFINQISVGTIHTAAVLADGTLWTWGANHWGNLGTSATISDTPQFVGGEYASVVASDSYTIALKKDGGLWGWGYNSWNEIDSTRENYRTPKQIGWGFNKIASNSNHSIAIKTDSSVWAWGNTIPGNGSEHTRTNPIQISSGFIAIAATQASYAAIKSDGSLWTWGEGHTGELGDGQFTSKSLSPKKIADDFIDIKGGAGHYLALKSDGSLWGWGYNNEGQLGLGSKTNISTPTLIGTNFSKISAGSSSSAGVKKDGSIWIWGLSAYLNANGQVLTEGIATPRYFTNGFVDVAVGSSVGFGVKADGSLWAWGFGGLYRNLGLGSNLYAETPTKVEFISPLDITPPTTPSFVTAYFDNNDSYVKISWTNSVDNIAVTEYKILRDGQFIGLTTTLNFIDYNILFNTRHTYEISACDAAGNCSEYIRSNEILTKQTISFESSANCIFSWANVFYPDLFAQPQSSSLNFEQYYVKEFSGSHSFLGIHRETNHLYYLGPATDNILVDLGSTVNWLNISNCGR